MTALTPAQRDAAMRWIADDPDPDTRVELQRVLAAALTGDREAAADLTDRMAGTLRFGTAGLRGPVRAGPNGMNVAVVRRTTAGLAHWLRARGRAGAPVVVGRDARRGSEAFAAAAAEVLAGAGFAVRTLPGPLPTPVLAFAVRRDRRRRRVSRSPPRTTRPPTTATRSTSTTGASSPRRRTPRSRPRSPPHPRPSPSPSGRRTGSSTSARPTSTGSPALPRGTARTLRIALTPLHGVGGETAVLALARAGFTDVHVVATAGRAGRRLPDGRVPEPGGARRHRRPAGDGRTGRCRPGRRPRPRRGPVRARRPHRRRAGGCSPATRRARCSATTSCGTGRQSRSDDRLVATTVVSSSMLRASPPRTARASPRP